MTANTVQVSSRAFEETGVPVTLSPEVLAETFASHALGAEPSAPARLGAVDVWPDSELIKSVRCDPPNEAALDVLVKRYWDSLFARCQMLTLNHEKALDLAQAAWVRVLRNRQALKPDGNFPAYLATIATNLFRDSYRAARRAGPLADYRMESLDAAIANDEGDGVMLVDVVPDLKTMDAEEQTLLSIDIDRALEQLSPTMRDVLLARFIDGESAAEIGRRYGRTEQTISGWIRSALRQMKACLEEPERASEVTDQGATFETA
jgi:RNA polymerase sigma-70 factor (ECF subfamily)